MQRPKYESKQLNNLIKRKTLKATCKAKYGPDAEEAYDTNDDTRRRFPNSLQEVCLSRQNFMRTVFLMNEMTYIFWIVLVLGLKNKMCESADEDEDAVEGERD